MQQCYTVHGLFGMSQRIQNTQTTNQQQRSKNNTAMTRNMRCYIQNTEYESLHLIRANVATNLRLPVSDS